MLVLVITTVRKFVKSLVGFPIRMEDYANNIVELPVMSEIPTASMRGLPGDQPRG